MAVVTLLSLLFGWFALLSDKYSQLGKHVASVSAFILNFVLVEEAGYFDNAASTKPMLHLWSLTVEEQFYVIWPLTLMLVWKRQSQVLILIVLICAASFFLSLGSVFTSPIKAFFWPFGRFWELLTGSVLAWLFLFRPETINGLRDYLDHKLSGIVPIALSQTSVSQAANLLSLMGLLTLAASVWIINEETLFPGFWALLPVTGTALVIVAGASSLINRILLMNPLMVWIGLISYPLYLWHWPVLSFMQIVEGEILISPQ